MTDLAYIDNVIEKAVALKDAASASLSDAKKAEAKEKANRVVAGFDVFDENREKELLDGMIAAQRKSIETFISDRAKAREAALKVGATPLAVVPTKFWNDLCDKAGLFRLSPGKNSKLGVTDFYRDHEKWIVKTEKTKTNRFYGTKYKAESFNLKYGAEDLINAFAADNWSNFLLMLWPDHNAKEGSDCTLVLPTPPKDVADILLKAEKLPLKVAAVSDAISFKESPASIMKKVVDRMEAEARAKEVRDADPIVYFEQGTACAVIAQFGEFPIEKAMVDFVVDNDDLIGETVDPLSPQSYASASGFSNSILADAYNGALGGMSNMSAEQLRALLMQQYMQQQQAMTNALYGTPVAGTYTTGTGTITNTF